MSICLCCGGPCKDGATYAPGHSAKHAANLAREVLSGVCTLEEAQAKISTPKLRETVARYAKTMGDVETKAYKRKLASYNRAISESLKQRSSTDAANAKYSHTPTPVDDCGEYLSFGRYCTNRLPCRTHPEVDQ